jgi:hypothetical protein
MDEADPGAEETAKVETCFSTVALEQDGQAVASPQWRTSFSKACAHSAQRYS